MSKILKNSGIYQKEDSIEPSNEHAIEKERYLEVINSYIKDSNKNVNLLKDIFKNLAEIRINDKKYISTQWALLSLLSICNNTYSQKIEYFSRILFLTEDFKKLEDKDYTLAFDTKATLAFYNIKLLEYLELNIISYFSAFSKAIEPQADDKMKDSIEFLTTEVFTLSNLYDFLVKAFDKAQFSKNFNTEYDLGKMREFFKENQIMFVISELRSSFMMNYEH